MKTYSKKDTCVVKPEKYNYNLNQVIDNNFKVKYSSIYGIIKSIKIGFRRILNYSILKKILLLGFFASSMFVVYSVCNIAGATDIRESDYMKIDRNYLQVDSIKVNVDDYLKYENSKNVDYIIPGDSNVSFKIKMDNYYQLSTYSFEFNGSLVDINKITESDITKGRMPQNEYEIVIDKKVVDNMLGSQFSSIKAMGIKSEEELLNRIVTIDDMKDFTIVGLVDKIGASIYVSKSLFINILNNQTQVSFDIGVYSRDDKVIDDSIQDYNLFLDDITLTKGRLPENDYEVIVNKNNYEEMKLYKPINVEVNGKKLIVVGYYDSQINRQDYLVNNNTVKYNVILHNNGFTIYPKDIFDAMNEFKNDYNLNIVNRYEEDRKEYIDSKYDEILSAVIFAGIMLIISLIEIYLMIRSSFLSRIKEIGIFRAIGVKKKDIYRMFLGEIIAITTIASLLGIALMTYILSQISKISYIDRIFIVNLKTIGISVTIVYLFNIIVGLLPIFKILRKEPAKILARHDVD